MGKLWFGGRIYTMVKENETVEAVYTDGGKITETGLYMQLKEKFKGTIEEEINLNGGMMLPGLVDSHLHLIGYGESLLRLNLSSMNSKEKVLNAIKEKCSQTEKGKWIVAEGWNENNWIQPDLIHKSELDDISTDHPIVLKRVCRHALIVNSKALEVCGIDENTEAPFGGGIGRGTDGELSGLFQDHAQDLIVSHLPSVDEEYLKGALRLAIADCYKYGITGVHTEDLFYYNGFNDTFKAIRESFNEMPLRAHLLVHHEVMDEMIQSGYSFKAGNEFVEFGAMKIFADGSLGGRTALLSRPYADTKETKGIAIHTEEELNELVRKARSFGMPVAIHAIGDEAFEMALKAIVACPPPEGTKDRLIHASILRSDLIERLRDVQVVLDIQPVFVSSDGSWIWERLGDDKRYLPYAWKTLLKNGIKCAGGSDAPIEKLNPLYGIYAAVTRRSPEEKGESFNPTERLSMYEAIQLFTAGSALAAGNEKRFGYIEKGFAADFSIFDRDLFHVAEEEIVYVETLMTVIAEKVVYKKG